MSEHKACPFCGSPDVYIEPLYGYGVFVLCESCSAQGPLVVIGPNDQSEEVRKQAWAAWNHRAEGDSQWEEECDG
jgi:Lar family restriction alleviation protein